MHLFFIRHGETVDNVAGLYAGSRDSALTVHGNLQVERLAAHLVGTRNVHFTHIFTSNLQRAFRTAGALKIAQDAAVDPPPHDLAVIQLVALREQDFGFYEGKPFFTRPRGSTKSGKDEHRAQHVDDSDFQDVESKDALNARCDLFIDDYLAPILATEQDDPATIAVVSHGMTLSHLWRCLLKRFPRHSVSFSLGDAGDGTNFVSLEHLGGWSNTAFLELEVRARSESDSPALTSEAVDIKPPPTSDPAESIWTNHRLTIKAVNSRAHLIGLKRTRGVGSSQFDEGQKKIETFFKKPKV